MLRKIIILIVVIALSLTTAILAAPGDSSDPIVVLSYLNQRISNLINDYKLDTLNDKISQLEDEINNSGNSTGGQSLEIVEIFSGEKIICREGTELILRGGEAIIIGSDLGGISDVTMGKDLVSTMAVPANHLLIVPRNDGRGVYTNNYAIFMVRGGYEVVK